MRLEGVYSVSLFCSFLMVIIWHSSGGVEWLSYLISGLGARLVDSVRAG